MNIYSIYKMGDISKKKSEYNFNIYNRFDKNSSNFEFILMYKKQNFTDNIFYYFLCIIFHYIPLAILSGDLDSFFEYREKKESFQGYMKKLTCHNIIKQLNLSYKNYCIIYSLILILLICRLIINFYIIKKFCRHKFKQNLTFIFKYKIIIEHGIFLFFPYIIEFLSFSY